jgi:glycosyltransferase involved in cell wall biosynthesis
MKVLIIHNAGDSALPSGEAAVVNNEIEALCEKGMTVHLHVMNNDSIRRLFSIKTWIAGLNIFWSYASFRMTTALIEKHKPDIVHFHGVLPLLTPSAFYACKTRGVPVVQTLHNFRWFCVEGGLYSNDFYCEECLKRGVFRGITKRCSRGSMIISALLSLNNAIYVKKRKLFNLVDRFIAVSNFLRDKHIEAGFPQDKITVKYNGIPLHKVPKIDTATNQKSGVAFAGRLTAAKGTAILKEIITGLDDVPFNIIGDGTDYAQLRRYCKNGNFKNVRFMGRVEPSLVYEIFSRSACVVVPSLFAETFGLVAAEAMACGTPVVASKIGGLKEIVEQSGGGITVDPGSPLEFVSTIKSIIGSPDMIEKMGSSGRNFVEKNLAMDVSINRLLDIYSQVIDKEGKVL